MKQLLLLVGSVILAVFSLSALGVPVKNIGLMIFERYVPCATPITYSIGTVDPQFGITRNTFQGAVFEAEQIWEKPVAKNLFAIASSGTVTVDLVYDYRQEVTNRLANLGISLKDNKATYDALSAKYESLKNTYETKKAAFEAKVAAYEARLKDYNAQVAYWNKQRRVPAETRSQLEEQRNELNAEAAELQAAQADLNNLVNNVNAVASALNQVASALNLNVAKYNTIGSERGEEFEEGIYESGASGAKIEIYEFSTRAQLVRVLAHEFGHALGLGHSDDTQAIMYRLNQGKNERLTATDLAALKIKCRIAE